MFLVLCSATDAAAIWAWQGLRARGLPAELVTAETLVAARWEHRVGEEGAFVRFRLPDGRAFDGRSTRGTLNRLAGTSAGAWAGSPDGDYVVQELHAFFVSWLHCLPRPVLNPPHSQGLSGRWRHPSEWAWLAGEAGLPATYKQSGRDDRAGTVVPFSSPPGARTVITVGNRVAGAPAPPAILDGCRRLAGLAGTPVLGVDFLPGPQGAWTFAGATSWPDLRLGGEPVLDHLAAALQEAA